MNNSFNYGTTAHTPYVQELIAQVEALMEELNLQGHIKVTGFKLSYKTMESILGGQMYVHLSKTSTLKDQFDTISEMREKTFDQFMWEEHWHEIFAHLNASRNTQQFRNRLKYLASLQGKALEDKRNLGTRRDGFKYADNIYLIRYDFVRYA